MRYPSRSLSVETGLAAPSLALTHVKLDQEHDLHTTIMPFLITLLPAANINNVLAPVVAHTRVLESEHVARYGGEVGRVGDLECDCGRARASARASEREYRPTTDSPMWSTVMAAARGASLRVQDNTALPSAMSNSTPTPIAHGGTRWFL